MEVPQELVPAVDAIVEELDDSGLLASPTDEIAARYDLPPTTIERVIVALRAVGPSGIAARSPLDCVRLQCATLVATSSAPAILIDIAESHLEDVADGRLDLISASLRRPLDEVERAVSVLRARVRPVAVTRDADDPVVRPDIVVRRANRERHRLVVEVADANWYGLQVEPSLSGGDPWWRPHERDARELIRQVDARADFLTRIGEDLLTNHHSFVCDGVVDAVVHRVDVARRLLVHPSTIGRAVRDKWMQCPDGRTVPISTCFDVAIGPRQAVAAAIAAEPNASDRRLAESIRASGVLLSRRTVAKYRLAAQRDSLQANSGSRRTA